MTALELQLLFECEGLIAAVREIVKNWESGDLARAVNNARELADATEDFIVNSCAEDT